MADASEPLGKLPGLQDFIAPFLNFWGQGNAEPLSGDVSQLFRIFSPSVTVEGRGDPDLETRITRDVATYGAQIGQLSEIVLALAAGQKAPADAVAKLTDIAREIDTVKTAYRKSALKRAREALADLEQHDKPAYETLVATLKTTR